MHSRVKLKIKTELLSNTESCGTVIKLLLFVEAIIIIYFSEVNQISLPLVKDLYLRSAVRILLSTTIKKYQHGSFIELGEITTNKNFLHLLK